MSAPAETTNRPVGAIAGGTVGGVVFLVVAISGFIFYLRSSKGAIGIDPDEMYDASDRDKSEQVSKEGIGDEQTVRPIPDIQAQGELPQGSWQRTEPRHSGNLKGGY